MLDFREKMSHGSPGFPVAAYFVTPRHPRYQMAFHWHPEHEILYVLCGRLELTLGKKTYSASAGDLFFIQGGTFHSAVASEECEYRCVVFALDRMVPDGHVCRTFTEGLGSFAVSAHAYLGKNPDGFLPLWRALESCLFSGGGEERPFTVTGLLFQFVGALSEQRCFDVRAPETGTSPEMLSALRTVLYKIENDYAKKLTLAELAALAGFSPNYFCRFFRKITSRSPMEYLLSCRIHAAEYLLRTTDRTVTDIALSCGFSDGPHFTRYFRRETGCTPTQFRAKTAAPATRS